MDKRKQVLSCGGGSRVRDRDQLGAHTRLLLASLCFSTVRECACRLLVHSVNSREQKHCGSAGSFCKNIYQENWLVEDCRVGFGSAAVFRGPSPKFRAWFF